MRWSCLDDCKYGCMHAVEEHRRSQQQQQQVHGGGKLQPSYGPVKYYGKWPFRRVAGMQEPLSVAMSLANLAAHLHCVTRLLRALRAYGAGKHPSAYPYAGMWLAYAAIHMNAWLWSAVFHSRDTRVTERLDYCSADAVVAMSLFCVLARMRGVKQMKSMLPAGCLIAAGFLALVHHMLFVKFDYGLNVQVCVAAGLVQALLWLLWCARSRHPHRNIMYLFLACAHAALLLEVLDFPPMAGAADAHALWHACTIPLTYLFYHFLALDAKQALHAVMQKR